MVHDPSVADSGAISPGIGAGSALASAALHAACGGGGSGGSGSSATAGTLVRRGRGRTGRRLAEPAPLRRGAGYPGNLGFMG